MNATAREVAFSTVRACSWCYSLNQMNAKAKHVGCAGAFLVGLGLCAWAAAAIVGGFKFSLARTLPAHPVSDAKPLIEFRDYPVYWLGMEYDGLALTRLSIEGPYSGGTERFVYLGYGYCKTSSGLLSGGCSPLVTVEEAPSCSWYTRDPELRMNPPTVWTRGMGIRVLDLRTPSPASEQLLDKLSLANKAYFPPDDLSTDPAGFWEMLNTECAMTPTPKSTPTP